VIINNYSLKKERRLGHSSSGRTPAKQAQGFEFKPWYSNK
jgi:hypothetical protein